MVEPRMSKQNSPVHLRFAPQEKGASLIGPGASSLYYCLRPREIHDALYSPLALRVLAYSEILERRAFNLNSGDLARLRDVLAVGGRTELKPIGVNTECSENHLARRHLGKNRIKPLKKQPFSAWRIAFNLDFLFKPDCRRIGHEGYHSQCGLCEGGTKRWTRALYI